MFKSIVRLAALFCLLAVPGTACAEGFALYEYGARGLALGGAVMARKPDASTVATNPALLTRLPGTHIMGGLTAISPSGKMDYIIPMTGKEGRTELRDSIWPVPHAYFTHQINDKLFFGVGEFTRFGLGFEYPHDWVGRFNIYEVALTTASINPNIAWKATDKLSIAAGVEIMYVTLDIRKRVLLGVDTMTGKTREMDSNIQDADAFGFGGNLAFHYQFNDQWAIGMQYRSPVEVHAKGTVDFSDVNKNAGIYAGMFKDGKAHATVVMPESIAGGISWTPTENLSIEAGAIWTRWSRFRNLTIHLPGGMPDAASKKRWHNAWRLNTGIEYQALDWLTLRAGYVWDQSPMPQRYEDYLVPTGDRNIYSVGFGVNYSAWTFDVGYAFIKPKSRSYREDLMGSGTVKSRTKSAHTQLLSLTIGYTF